MVPGSVHIDLQAGWGAAEGQLDAVSGGHWDAVPQSGDRVQ